MAALHGGKKLRFRVALAPYKRGGTYLTLMTPFMTPKWPGKVHR